MPIQLYGNFESYLSFSNVSRAMARAFKQKHIPFTIHGMGSLMPTYLDAPWKVAMNSHASVGACIAYPPAAMGYLKSHTQKVLITVCETSKIPSEWADAFRAVDQVVVPSTFVRNTFLDAGCRTKITVAPHGIDPRVATMSKGSKQLDRNKIKLLHVTGAVSFPQRKGTPQLLGAMYLLKKAHPEIELTIKTFRLPGLVARIAELGLENTVVIDDTTESLTPLQMAQYITQFDAVIQPSRGEGFGLLPLESRCMGVPVIMTAVTGHLDHYAPGVDIEVSTGPYTLMKSQGNPDGAAPAVYSEQVADAIKAFIKDIPGHNMRTLIWANRFANSWTWPKVLHNFVSRLEASARKRDRAVRFGDSLGLRGV